MKILFVDDEPGTTQALRMLVEAKGFECITSTNMTSAMRILREQKVSVVVSDIMMPGGEEFDGIDSSETGFHFVARVRKEYPHTQIVCLSVIGDQSKIQELKRKGVHYLRKGETPLDTAARLIESKASGVAHF